MRWSANASAAVLWEAMRHELLRSLVGVAMGLVAMGIMVVPDSSYF